MTDEARRAKYISRILKLLDHFYFYILPSYTCVERGGDVMSYFASSSSYSNTFLVSAFTISQKWKSISIFSIYAKKKLFYFIENARNKEKRHKTLKKLLPKRFWCLISQRQQRNTLCWTLRRYRSLRAGDKDFVTRVNSWKQFNYLTRLSLGPTITIGCEDK